jgi:GTP-binding protein
VKEGELVSRQNGVLVSMVKGKTLAYALYNLQDRGRLLIGSKKCGASWWHVSRF